MSCPKILRLTNKGTGQVELINPFRVNRWLSVPAPSAQPYLAAKMGTEVIFTGRDRVFVVETVAEIERMIQGLKPLKRRAKKDAAGQTTFPV